MLFPAPWSAKAEITKPRVLRDLEEGTEREKKAIRLTRQEQSDTYHDTGVMIQYIEIYWDTLSKAIHDEKCLKNTHHVHTFV